jgi:copper resistance protein D
MAILRSRSASKAAGKPMDWLGTDVDGPLVVVRGLHFAATAITTGTLIFRAVVAGVASGSATPAAVIVSRRILSLAWICLAISTASGIIWVLLQAPSMSGLPFADAMTSAVLMTVVNETQFGMVSEIRFALAVVIGVCLAYDRFPPARWLGPAFSLCLIGAVGWTGHAGSTVGDIAILHLAADILHLVAAAVWIGGLVSLVLLFAVTRRDRTDASMSLARDATQAFSSMGIAIVVVIFATGIVNSWILVGSWHALIATGYGQLLMLKIVLFIVMLLFAAANRFWLTPRLALPSSTKTQRDALGGLTRNSAIEFALALVIFAIVGILGTLHPAIHGM